MDLQRPCQLTTNNFFDYLIGYILVSTHWLPRFCSVFRTAAEYVGCKISVPFSHGRLGQHSTNRESAKCPKTVHSAYSPAYDVLRRSSSLMQLTVSPFPNYRVKDIPECPTAELQVPAYFVDLCRNLNCQA